MCIITQTYIQIPKCLITKMTFCYQVWWPIDSNVSVSILNFLLLSPVCQRVPPFSLRFIPLSLYHTVDGFSRPPPSHISVPAEGKGRSSKLGIYTVSYYARAVPVSVHLRPALTSQGGVDQIRIIEPLHSLIALLNTRFLQKSRSTLQ